MSKILLLEPDALLGNIYQAALEHAGHEVAHYTNAQTAVLGMDKSLPDIIITELQLAMHNGIEFLYELRSYVEWQDIPIVVLSNVPSIEQESIAALWKDIHITAYHYKPLAKLQHIIDGVDCIFTPAV
jgi:DNA-binding response OmpR family regulator